MTGSENDTPQTPGENEQVLESLNDMKKWGLEESADLFKGNLDRIFRYGIGDVSDTLSVMDLTVVNSIRGALVDLSIEKFPQMKDHRVPQRTVIHTAVKDVCTLGYSIANDSLTRDAEKIFIKDKSPAISDVLLNDDSATASQLQTILENMLDLQKRVGELEKDVASLRTENSQLKDQLKEGAKNNMPDSIHSEGTEPNINVVSSDSDTEGDDYEVPRSHKKKAKKKAKQDAAASAPAATATSVITEVKQPVPSTSQSGLTAAPAVQRQANTKGPQDKSQLSAAPAAVRRADPQNPQHSSPAESVESVDIVITGADLSTPKSQIHDALTRLGVHKAGIQDITRRDGSASWKSFKVTLPAAKKNYVLQKTHWPKGITVRPFYPRNTNQPFRNQFQRTNNHDTPHRNHDHRQQAWGPRNSCSCSNSRFEQRRY